MPHAHVPCRYRRPQHSAGAVVGVRCSAPPGKIQTCCRDAATGILVKCLLPEFASTTFFALKLQHTVMPLAMTQSLMTALAPAAMTSNDSVARSAQLARGMFAAAQLCFTSAETRAWLRSLVVSSSEDIDANVIDTRARGNYDPLKHAGFVDNRGERPQVDEHCRASLIQAVMRTRKVQSQGSIATTVDRVPRSSVHDWVHADMRVLQSAWWGFCRDAHGVYILKEDGARIGQPGRETVHHLLRQARSEIVFPAAPQAPPNGETIAFCAYVERVEART